jgi:putative transposase
VALSPDGTPLVYVANGQLYLPASVTSDGKTLVFRQGGDAGSSNLDIGIVRLEGNGEPEMLLDTSFDEHTPKLSPDDRWLAYVSNESGRDEVYCPRARFNPTAFQAVSFQPPDPGEGGQSWGNITIAGTRCGISSITWYGSRSIGTGFCGAKSRSVRAICCGQIAAAREVQIIRGAVSPDHIHMLVVVPPQLAPAKLVQFLKGRSSRMLQAEFQHLRKRYWGQHLWARGYFCATVGAVDERAVMAYIESQQWDEDVDGFKVTAPTEP